MLVVVVCGESFINNCDDPCEWSQRSQNLGFKLVVSSVILEKKVLDFFQTVETGGSLVIGIYYDLISHTYKFHIVFLIFTNE